MTNATEAKAGYIRAEAGVKLLDSAVATGCDDPGIAYLDLLTEDGRLHLAMSQTVAEDLVIDLQQFLKVKSHTTTGGAM